MKKVKFTSKLSLNKETVTKLNEAQMENIIGGETNTIGTSMSIICLTTLLSPTVKASVYCA